MIDCSGLVFEGRCIYPRLSAHASQQSIPAEIRAHWEVQLTYHVVHPQDHPHHLCSKQELLSLGYQRVIYMLCLHVYTILFQQRSGGNQPLRTIFTTPHAVNA